MNALEAKATSTHSTSLPLADGVLHRESKKPPFLRNSVASFCLLLCAITCARILLQLLSPLNLSPDEAHYWEWSRRLDWSYYSKGPIVAWLIAVSTVFWGNTEWGVRFPALLHSVLLMVGLYWFLARNVNQSIAFWSVALLHSGVFFFGLGLGMTTDAPCLFTWLMALVLSYRAVFKHGASNNWRWAGAFAGIAALSKYTALFIFPGFLLVFLVVNALGPQLYQQRFWQGWGISLMACEGTGRP